MAGISLSGAIITQPEPRRALSDAVQAVRAAAAARGERRRAYDQTLRELQTYSRRDLLDIGIDPDGIHAVAREAACLAGRSGRAR